MESYPEITSAQQLQAILEGNKLTIIACSYAPLSLELAS
jgi:hypothetical protein